MTTEDTALDGFELDEWLAGARPPERAITVYGRADLVADLEALDADYEAARSAGDRRLGGPADDIRQRMRALRAEMESSRLTVRVRGLDRDTILGHAERFKDDEDEVAVSVAQVAAAAVSPRMSEDQARRLMERIGWGQFRSIADVVWETSTRKQVTVPFSRATSDDDPTS